MTPRASAVLLDVDGVLAPIVAHPDDAHMPETTRRPLIDVAKRYGVVACVSGRRASDARRIVSLGSIAYLGSHGSEVLRPGSIKPEMDRELQAWTRRVQDFAHDAFGDDLRQLRVRLEDKEAIAALHWRGVPDEDDAEQAIREVAERAEKAGFTTHWGRKVLEIRPPVRIDKGAGIVSLLRDTDLAAALYVGDDVTDLDAFRGLDELIEKGRLGTRDQGRRALRRGPGQAQGRGRLDGRGHGRRPRAAPGAARLIAPRALRGSPQGHGPARRRLRDAAGDAHAARDHARGRPRRDLRHRRLVGRRRRDRRGDGRARRCVAGDRAAARRRAHAVLASGVCTPAPRWSTACGRCCWSPSAPGRRGSVEPQIASVAAGGTIIWALAWRRQERAVLAIEERDGVRFYVDKTSPFSPIRLVRTPGFGGDYLARGA